MPEHSVHRLLQTAVVAVRDVVCGGLHPGPSDERRASASRLVIPYRGAFVRHCDVEQVVVESGQVLLINPTDGYRISHPVLGGHANVDLILEEGLLRELCPKSLLTQFGPPRFSQRRLGIDPRAQALSALLRHSLHQGTAEVLEAESLALTLAQRALGPRTTRGLRATAGRRRLVDRAKLLIAGDLSRRWTLSDIATDLHCSPVYLTQLFQQAEGVPLYRYQLRVRLARALDLLPQYEDISALSFELGFSSHSHFSAAFKQAYGRSPSEFRQFLMHR
jgi:AraC-like DNA-binding protein